MREILEQIDRWQGEGKRVAVATVVKVWGSAPRPLGSKMVISSKGEMAGSVSGGCVEGAVAEEARAVLESGEPKLVHFGVSDDTAWSVGLSCGGQIEVFIESLEAAIEPLKA
jgi:xanthine/CO dehydrogenase XdhC/CoxF family maturation factor